MAGGILSREARGGRRRRRARRARPMSEINVTPFVDVMLVLLVVFMVAAPLLTVGVPVDLPETAAAPLTASSQEEPLAVTVTAEGGLAIQETPVEEGDLVGRLRAIAGERESDRVFLRADGAVPYARVAEVMGALNAAGFADLSLVTEPGGPDFGGGADAPGG